jgi:membrane protein DedA with SNARE-associated domain
MEYLNDTFSLWLLEYGSMALFFLLALGIVALPIPDETLMVISGVMIHQGHLYAIPTLMAAYLGSMCGITLSYMLGKTAGHFIIKRFGKWIGINEARLKKAHDWYEYLGKWTLTFGYFIPGVRHLTGVLAGMTELTYTSFALFAYSGAFLWATVFLSMGYFFGPYWSCVLCFLDDHPLELIVAGISILLIIWLSKRRDKSKTVTQ